MYRVRLRDLSREIPLKPLINMAGMISLNKLSLGRDTSGPYEDAGFRGSPLVFSIL